MSRILDLLNGDTTLLTVNKRLASELRTRYDHRQAALGRTVWPTPDILAWGAWLTRLYGQLLDNGDTEHDLLSRLQERLLWQQIIEQAPDQVALMRPSAAAATAQNANALVLDWQLDPQTLLAQGGDETRRFVTWQHAFNAALTERGLLSAAQLPGLICEAFTTDTLPIPPRLVYAGFEALTPAQRALFDLLGANGCAIEEYRDDPGRGDRRRIAAEDSETEIRLAAEWARQRLRDDPQARIGIVSPRITEQRADLQRIFTETLAPATYLLLRSDQNVFNISLGTAITDCPLVAHAGLVLDLLQGRQPLHAIGQLLRSPFIGGHATEWERRALFDSALREDGLPQVDLQRLAYRLRHLDEQDLRYCPDLATRIDRLLALARALPGSAPPDQWLRHFNDSLQILGWPGDTALSSEEFQQYERTRRLFGEFAELAKVRPRLNRGEAIALWHSLGRETLFQAESPDTPIQILGPLESAGLTFDALWLLGLDDYNWPPAPQSNPLLPNRLQRDLEMPHASAARELAFAAALTERLVDSADTVVASHPCSEGDRERRPSPLILTWPLVDAATLIEAPAQDLERRCQVADRLEMLPSAAAYPAPQTQRGGAALLAAQARCPFQATARFRLGARPLDEPSTAADGPLIGKLLHELLQRVWQQLRDSTTLARHDAGTLQTLVAPLASATLEDLGRRRPDLMTPRFSAIEGARLTRLVIDWLGVERARTQGFEVLAMEQDQAVELEGLRLTTRADRLDRLADGSLAVIDYKTGRSVGIQGWFDERLSEPQLPLYCLTGEGEVSAALLARVRPDPQGCGFVGLSRDAVF
ncbi:MAG: PD-(D/E)XK nuclease family protein, partial [Chromatiaceae bacterium]